MVVRCRFRSTFKGDNAAGFGALFVLQLIDGYHVVIPYLHGIGVSLISSSLPLSRLEMPLYYHELLERLSYLTKLTRLFFLDSL